MLILTISVAIIPAFSRGTHIISKYHKKNCNIQKLSPSVDSLILFIFLNAITNLPAVRRFSKKRRVIWGNHEISM